MKIITEAAPRAPAQLNDHDTGVLRLRAIACAVAEQRGYRTVTETEARGYGFDRSGLLIPSFNTQGLVERWQLRPHTPRIDPKDRPRKYEWPTGSGQSLDVPPASLPMLGEVDVPVIVTELALKADSIVSAIAAEGLAWYAVVAVAGVYGWRRDGAPISDFGDVRWCHKERDRIRQRRRVLLAFDSDAVTNEKVARARWELGQHLRRRGAAVALIDVPVGRDGGKQGVDDALAGGVLLSDMIASAYPTPHTLPAIPRLNPGADRRDDGVLVLALKSPHVKGAIKVLVAQIATLAMAKRDAGTVRSDGRVDLSAAEIAHDWRPRMPKGEQLPSTNPDGSTPYMRRQRVADLLSEAIELGILDGEDVEIVPVVREHASGAVYKDKEILVTPPASVPSMLAPLAAYVPNEPKRREYHKSQPCPECGEVHDRRRDTMCAGCGAVIRTETLVARDDPQPEGADVPDEVPSAPPVDATGSPIIGEVKTPLPPPPSKYSLSPIIGEVTGRERTGPAEVITFTARNRTASTDTPDAKAANGHRVGSLGVPDRPPGSIWTCTTCVLPRSLAPGPCPACGETGGRWLTPMEAAS